MNERLAIEWRDLRYLNEISFAMLKQTKLTVLKYYGYARESKEKKVQIKEARLKSSVIHWCLHMSYMCVIHVIHVIEILHLNYFLSFISEWDLAFISLIGVWFG